MRNIILSVPRRHLSEESRAARPRERALIQLMICASIVGLTLTLQCAVLGLREREELLPPTADQPIETPFSVTTLASFGANIMGCNHA